MITQFDTISISGSLPPYDRTDEWRETLLNLQTHLEERRERHRDDLVSSSKEDEVQEALMQVSLRKMGIIIEIPETKKYLNDWADILLCGREDQKELVIAALEKCLPLLLEAPVRYASNIIAAAEASIEGEEISNAEVEGSDLVPPAVERSLHDSSSPGLPTNAPDLDKIPSIANNPSQSNFNEDAWNTTLRQLQNKLQDFENNKDWRGKRKGKKNGKENSSTIKDIIGTMIQLASLHPDARVKDEIKKQAERIESADDKENVFRDFRKGVGLLLLTPFALAGAAVFAAGTLIYGSGKIVIGLGNILTLGKLRK